MDPQTRLQFWTFYPQPVPPPSCCKDFAFYFVINWVLSLNLKSTVTATVFTQCTLQRYNTENSKQIFPEKELLASPIATFMCLSAIYKSPRSVCLFCCRKICGPILGIYCIHCSQTHEWENWEWGRTILSLGINKWDFHSSVAGAWTNSSWSFRIQYP
jgi:hypothetical protein